MNKYLSTNTFNFQWLGIERQRSSYADILAEDLISNGLHLKEQNNTYCKPRRKKKKKNQNPNPLVPSLLFLGKQCTALLFTVINIWWLITLPFKSPIPYRTIVLYTLAIKTLPMKINMCFRVIKQELILYFFTSSHLLWHQMVMRSRECSICFNPRKIRLEN